MKIYNIYALRNALIIVKNYLSWKILLIPNYIVKFIMSNYIQFELFFSFFFFITVPIQYIIDLIKTKLNNLTQENVLNLIEIYYLSSEYQQSEISFLEWNLLHRI